MNKLLTIVSDFLLGEKDILNTGINDAFPYFRSIDDFPINPAPKEVLRQFEKEGVLNLKPGVYDFDLKSFCLNAGKYSPYSGYGYLLAPIKGDKSEVIKHLLKNYVSRNDIPQSDVQSLIWAILAKDKYSDFTEEMRLTADKLLEKSDLDLLGKSFLDKIPDPIKNWLWEQIQGKLPNEITAVWDRINELRSKIRDAQTSFEELESIAVRFGKPPVSEKTEIKEGTWSLVGDGYFARIFPDGYSRTRMQVYVPEKVEFFSKRDSLGRMNEMGINDGINIKIEFDEDPNNQNLVLNDGKKLPIWPFKKIKFSLPDDKGKIDVIEIDAKKNWVAKNLETLASFNPDDYPEIKEKIESAYDIYNDAQTYRGLAGDNSGYLDLLNREYFKELEKKGLEISPKERAKTIIEHLNKLRHGFYNLIGDLWKKIGGLGDDIRKEFRPSNIGGVPADSNLQREGLGGLYESFEL